MKKRIVFCWAALVAAAVSGGVRLDGVWDFRFEEGASIEACAAKTGAGFEATDPIAVPGCFDTMPKWFLKRGTGIYRRRFRVEKAVEKAWLVVDGMGLRAKFWIDGKDLGTHPYPYAKLEIPAGALAEGEHEIFAAVDNRFDWETTKLARPYYDFYFYGGFYNGVRIEFDNRKLFVRTRDYAKGEVEIEAVNFAKEDFAGVLTFDGKNRVEAEFRGRKARVKVPGFRLWSPEEPNLHRVELEEGGKFAASARFGIREVKAAAKKIWLNGKPVFLKGVNRHEQNIEYGAATPPAQKMRDLQIIKGLGANFVRGAHYQQSQEFLDMCDEMGIMVWEESLGWGNGQDYTMMDKVNELEDAEFVRLQVEQTRQMVRASFNHPSVIIFGFLNECEGSTAAGKALVDKLIATIRAEDSGRLVTFAANRIENDISHANTDIAAFNTYPGVIPCEPGLPGELKAKVEKRFASIVDHFRKTYPEKPIMCSECGCGGMWGMRDDSAVAGSEDFQLEYYGYVLEALWGNPEVQGYSLWQFADTRSYSRNSNRQPGKLYGGSVAGIVTHQRRPKLSAALIKEYFRKR